MEKEVELLELLLTIKVREGMTDHWILGGKGDGRYTAREAYNVIYASNGR